MSKNGNTSAKEEQKKKIRARYKGVNKDEIEFIPARPRQKLFEEAGTKRVCAYCRVSTDDPKQTSSYELQQNHYEDVIREHPGWELVSIFADEGISGTSLEHRESFNAMIEQCKAGSIDLVVTKSVSRFARNIVDCIKIVRELANLTPPVGVFFEAEHIYTLEGTSEMILAVLSATAQEESRTKSEIMNISIEQRFSRGIFMLTELLGFRKDAAGNLVINEDEADTVRLCFYLFLDGYSCHDIAGILTELKRPRKHGKTEWDYHAVLNVLRNEKHCGDVLARKTFTPNYLTHKSRKNRQDRNQYRKKNHHKGIVPREVFLAAGNLIDSHKHMKSGCSLPFLKVIKSGFLQGYVPINLGWTGFSADDYLNASKEHSQSADICNAGIDRPGFQIARMQMFSTYQAPALRISSDAFTFTSACMKKFGDVEYVEILFNALAQKIAIRPCPSRNPAAVHWGKNVDGHYWRPDKKSAIPFANVLFPFMGWDADYVYRFCGVYYKEESAQLLLFDLTEPELLRRRTNPNAKADTSSPTPISKAGETTTLPATWNNTFGPNAEAVRRRQEIEMTLYTNGRDIGQEAKTMPESNGITEEGMKAYLIAAETIMQKMRP